MRSAGVVHVGAFGLEERLAVLLGLRLGAGVRRREAGLDALGDELLGLGDEGLDHLVLGHDPHDLALDEQVALVAPGRDAEVGLAGLARAVDDTAHDRHLEGQRPGLEGLLGSPGDVDHVDLGTAARRAGDEVEALALAQPERLEQLATGPRLLDRVGGERVADRVADALGEKGRRSRRFP